MSAPVFAAFPPEVFSALLSTGPGSGPLLAAATALQELAAQYTGASEELLAALAASATEFWEGPSSELFQAAHQPFLAWLAESAAEAVAAAAQHEVVAGAYEAALASMPTLAELAANHATNAALVATNFLGINTIPIAINEADYARMWMQAATTMSVYQATAGVATAAVPQTMSAPPTMNPGMSGMSRMAAAPYEANAMSDAVQARALMDSADNNSLQELLKDLVNQVQNFIDRIRQGLETLLASPALLALAGLLFFIAYEAFFIPFGFTAWGLILAAPFIIPVALGVVLPLALNAAAGQDAPDDQPDDDGDTPNDDRPKNLQTQQVTVVTTSSAPAPAPTASSAPAPPPPPASTAPATPPPMGAEGGYGYAVEGEDPPGAQFGPTSTTGASASASSPASASAAALAASKAQETASAKRSQSARARGRGRKVVMEEGERMRADGFMDLDQPSTGPSASEIGAGLLGFAGAAPGQTAEAAGFAKLPDGTFQTGPTIPMLPQTWAEAEAAAGKE